MKRLLIITLLLIQSSVFAVDENKWDEYIQNAANETGIDADFIKAIVKQESAFRDDIGDGSTQSSAGAIGAMQLLPSTADDLGYSVEDLKDPATNIMAGAEYLKWLSGLSYIDGDPALMAAAYNAGPGAVQQYNGIPPYSETVPYVQNVAQNYQNYSGNTINTDGLPSPTVDGGSPGIPIDLAQPTVLADISEAIESFEQLTNTSVSTINKFFEGILVFLMMLLAGVLVLFFWKDGVSQDDDGVFASSFFYSLRALFLMSILFVFLTAL